MNLWEGLTLIATGATILGIFLAIYGAINNKTIKHETKLTREAIQTTQQTLTKALAEESRLTRQMIKEIAEYLGNLIVADGERTRLAIER